MADAYLKELQAANDEGSIVADTLSSALKAGSTAVGEPMDATPDKNITDQINQRIGGDTSQLDTPDVPIRFAEKKRLDWAAKTCMFYLTIISFHFFKSSGWKISLL